MRQIIVIAALGSWIFFANNCFGNRWLDKRFGFGISSGLVKPLSRDIDGYTIKGFPEASFTGSLICTNRNLFLSLGISQYNFHSKTDPYLRQDLWYPYQVVEMYTVEKNRSIVFDLSFGLKLSKKINLPFVYVSGFVNAEKKSSVVIYYESSNEVMFQDKYDHSGPGIGAGMIWLSNFKSRVNLILNTRMDYSSYRSLHFLFTGTAGLIFQLSKTKE